MASSQAARVATRRIDVGAALLDAERVVGVVGERGQGRRRRWEPKPEGRRAGRRLAVLRDEHAPRPAGRVAGHLLLEDRRNERLEHCARAGQPDAGEPAGEVVDEAVVVADRRLLAIEPEERGHVRQGAISPGSPCLGPDLAADMGQRDRGRTVRRAGRPPSPPGRQPEGRIAVSATKRGQRSDEVERPADRVGSSGHGCSLSRFRKVPGRRSHGRQRASMLPSSRRATPQGRRERGAHRRACHASPSPVRPAHRAPAHSTSRTPISSGTWRWRRLSAGRR